LFDRFFASGYRLKYLSLARNRIQSLSFAHFVMLGNLETLDISNNLIQNIDAPNGLFSSLTKLSILDLDQNLLDDRNIVKIKFNDCFNLVYLNLSYNKLTSVNTGLFENLKKLELIDLSYNYLIQIESGSFYSLSSLKKLFLLGDQMGKTALNKNFKIECDSLSLIYISSIDFVVFNVEALVNSLQAVKTNKVVNEAVYYESINIIVNNFKYYQEQNLTISPCLLTILMLKNKIHLNLYGDYDVDLFFVNCLFTDFH
jgi:hypothetical protein